MKRLKGFAIAKKVIEISLQSMDETNDVINFNKENNYEYELVHDGNMLDADCLLTLLRSGYKITSNYEPIVLKRQELIEQEEKENEKYYKRK